MKIGLDLANIFTELKKIDWSDGGAGRREGEKGKRFDELQTVYGFHIYGKGLKLIYYVF